MPAQDALTLKAETFQALHTGAWSRFANAFASTFRGAVGPGTSPIAPDYRATGDALTSHCATTLSLAETFYVSPQMNALVTAAAEKWPEDETVEPEDFPTDHGWLFLPGGGIATIDQRGSLIHTSAIMWSRSGSTMRVSLWCDKRYDPDVQQVTGAWRVMPQMSPWHLIEMSLSKPVPTSLRLGKILPPEVSAGITFVESPEGYALHLPVGWDATELHDSVGVGPDPLLTWLVSALRIMQQPLASLTEGEVSRQARRAVARMPRQMANNKVTVIDFRRRASDGEVGTGREFSHRFMRRGHWRRQWIGSEANGDRRQARIWIHPTIVGPADKPLILREHVNALTR